MSTDTSSDRYPQDDQTITIVGVSNGAVSVGTATVLLSKPSRVIIRLNKDEADPSRGQAVTLLYDRGGERILRLKTKVSDVIEGGKCLLEPTGPVSEGERREFLRASVTGRVFVEIVPDDFELIDDTTLADSRRWPEQELDLSGSGVKMNWEGPCKKGQRVHIQMALGDEQAPVNALGDVVRARPVKGSRELDVAVYFTELSEPDRDRLINVVFKHLYQQVGSRFGTTLTLE